MGEPNRPQWSHEQDDIWSDPGYRSSFFKIDGRKAILKLEDGSIINGKINLCTELATDEGTYDKFSGDLGAFYKRVSDLFTKGKNPFVVVFDATVGGETGKVLVVNKNKILWVSPQD
jgi:hypothetical protein